MLAAFILIPILLCGAMSDCPNDCQCSTEIIKCRQIPQLIPSSGIETRVLVLENSSPIIDVKQLSTLTEVQAIDLNGLSITNIKNDEESVILPNLKILNLSLNKISRISETTFTWCPNLTHLDLSNNKIKTVEKLTFNAIEFLNLSHNLISSFDSSINLSPSLIELDLNNNQLEEVPELNQLTQLRRLHVCGNNYETLPGYRIKDCAQLEMLCLGDFMNNGIDDEGAIARLPHLRQLHLINKKQIHQTIIKEISNLISLQFLRIDFAEITNFDFLINLNNLERLEMIEVKVLEDVNFHFDGLKNINYIDLSGSENLAEALLKNHKPFDTLTTLLIKRNNVSTIPLSSLPQLAYLDISENPLLCDENLINFATLPNLTIFHSEKTKCSLPSEFSGLVLRDVIIMKNHSNFTPSKNETEEPKLDLFLDRMGITRDHLFYVCVGLIALLIICMAVIVILSPSKCKKREGVTHTGWRGRFGEGDSLCNDDSFFPKADNEYIFDNFSLSNTLARDVNPAPLSSQSTQ